LGNEKGKSKVKSQKAKVKSDGGFLMGFVTQVLAEALWYFVGLDLGQSRDHSALAVVERADLILDEIDHATYERLRERQYRVRFLERVALGTPYPNVVERARGSAGKAAGGPVHIGDGRDGSWGAGAGSAAACTAWVWGSSR
jgi:hypothetical protein